MAGHAGSRCSRSGAGGAGWWGDLWTEGHNWSERTATVGADDQLKRNMELNVWSAALHLLRKRRQKGNQLLILIDIITAVLAH